MPSQRRSSLNAIRATDFPRASGGQRTIALVLDTLICGILAALLSVVAKRFIGADLNLIFNSVITGVYFIALQLHGGQTLGKRLMNIRVVSLSDEPLSFGQLAKRELLGRSLSVVLFMYGYIRPFFREDRMALHDSLSATCVIALSRDTRSAVRWYHVAGLATLALTVLVGVSYYVAVYTTYPLQKLAEQLEVEGYALEGLSGNSVKGYRIERVARSEKTYDFEIRDVGFQFESDAKTKAFSIKQLTMGSGRIQIKTDLSRFKNLPLVTAQRTKDVAPLKQRKAFFLNHADVTNLEIVLNNQSYQIKRLYLSNAALQGEQLTIERFWLESDALDLNIEEAHIAPGSIELKKTASGKVRPLLLPFLQKEMHFELQVAYDGKLQNLRASVFDRRVQIDLAGQRTITITAFTPSEYLQTSWPLANLNLSAPFNAGPELPQFAGSLDLRAKRFLVSGNKASSQPYELALVAKSWRELLAGPPKLILLSENRHLDPLHLTQLYYQRPFQQLTPGEQDRVTRDAVHFAAAPTPALQIPKVRVPAHLPPTN